MTDTFICTEERRRRHQAVPGLTKGQLRNSVKAQDNESAEERCVEDWRLEWFPWD